VLHTYYMAGDYDRALEEGHRTSDPIEARALGAMGREAEAIDAARREEARFAHVPMLQSFSTALHAALEGRARDALAALDALDASGFRDGEGLFYVAIVCARIGETERAHRTLELAVDGGFVCLEAFDRDPYLSPVRTCEWWEPLRARVHAAHDDARAAFAAADGPGILGLPTPTPSLSGL
jgi:hypothetical protein